MEISKNKVVAIDYTLKDDAGNMLDTSEGKDPLIYIHGLGYLIPGLENALEGKKSGESLKVSIEPKDGYGEYNSKLLFEVEKEKIQSQEDIKVGMPIQMQTKEGPVVLTVQSVEDEMVKLDANHPLAGKNLNFDIEIKEVREATEEEIQHGHVHKE